LKLLSLTSLLPESAIAHAFWRRCSSGGHNPHKNMVSLRFGALFRTSFSPQFRRVDLNLISYLLNGNIQAAKAFMKQYTASLPSTLKLKSSDSTISVGQQDEVEMTKEPLVNFSQIAVLTCQRAQGDQNKIMRESWVRLCGTYQSKVGLLASPGMRKVSCTLVVSCEFIFTSMHLVPRRYSYSLFRYPTTAKSTGEPFRRHVVVLIWRPCTSATNEESACPSLKRDIGVGLVMAGICRVNHSVYTENAFHLHRRDSYKQCLFMRISKCLSCTR